MATGLDGIRILLAEDEILLRELLLAHFQMRGAHIDCANNGVVAFALFSTNSFDVVVTDIRMPGEDGLTLLRRIREKDLNNPPVLIITGYSDFSNEDLKKFGANAVLQKPFDVHELEKSILDVLQKA